MSLWKDFLGFFGGEKEVVEVVEEVMESNEQLAELSTKSELPINGGRSSQPSDFSVLGAIMGAGLQIQNDVTQGQYKAIERVVRTKPDPSQAANNIVLLGGQKVEIIYPATMSRINQKRANVILDSLRKTIYNGGENSLVSDLLFQLATYGALSAEMVLDERTLGVKNVTKLNPSNVRAVYNTKTNEWEWYQVHGFMVLKGVEDINGLKLNKNTYKYIPLVTANEKPYGLPPFLAALEDIAINEELFCGLKDVIKKMGLLGFLEVLVDVPEREMGEEFDVYQTRLASYLSTKIAPEVKKSLNNGFVIGFKDSHEFKLQDTVSNITGFEKIFELISGKIHSGLKQNPMLLGKNMTTTESLATVILSVMSSQINTYQRCVSNFLESVYLMHLRLSGFVIDSLEVKIAAPVLKDELKTEQTTKEKIANVRAKLEMGVIDLQQAANELGYQKAAVETPPQITVQTSTNYYSHTCKTCEGKAHEKLGIKETAAYVESYYKKVSDKYEKSTKKITTIIGQKLSKLGSDSNINDVVSVVISTLTDSFGAIFTDSITDIISAQIETMYAKFRKDKTPFKGMSDVPAATFGTRDFRTIDFWKGFDSFYFGKFVTDQDTQDRLTQWLVSRYANDTLPIGKNKEAIAAFRNEFPNAMIAEDWKIRRIVDTSVSKLRNTASVNYMSQAQITNYEIVGIGDQLQCSHCAALQGKKFSVTKTVELVEKMIAAAPEDVPKITPFAVDITPENLKKYSGDALISAGIANPPFHPHCRDTIVISLD